MDKILTINKSLDKIFPRLLSIAIIFYFLKNIFWPITYLFIVSYIMVLGMFIFLNSWNLNIKKFIKTFYPSVILVIIYFLVLILNWHISNVLAIKGFVLVLVLHSLYYFLFWMRESQSYEIPTAFIFRYLLYSISIIALLNLINWLIPISSFEIISKHNVSSEITIANDYNFFSLFMIFGLILIDYKKKYGNNYFLFKKEDLIFNFIFILNIILSGSKRGLIILLTLIIVYIVRLIYTKKINMNFFLRYFTLYLFISLIIVYAISFLSTDKITKVAFRYAQFFGIKNIEYVEDAIFNFGQQTNKRTAYLIDSESFTMDDYWGIFSAEGVTMKKIDTPYGVGYKVVKKSGIEGGYSPCYKGPTILYYANHTYIIKFKVKFIKGNINSFNVGWGVDDGSIIVNDVKNLKKHVDSLDNGWYNCTSSYTFRLNHYKLTGFISSVKIGTEFIISDFELIDLDYNDSNPRYTYEIREESSIISYLNKINPPPIARTDNLIINGDFSSGLRFWGCNADSTIIKHTVLDGENCLNIKRTNGNGGGFSLFHDGMKIKLLANNKYLLSMKVKTINTVGEIPFCVGYWVNDGDGYITCTEKTIYAIENGWYQIRSVYVFRRDHENFYFPINSQIDNSEFYITDISLYNLSADQNIYSDKNFEINTENKSIYSTRIDRWKYAVELWNNKYKWYHKLFGHGFEYFNWYGEKFYPNQNKYDWPHNPFIAVLLYSGIIGFIIYVLFLIKVVAIYTRHRKKYGIAFVGFILTLFFSFFSANSPFNPPVMGFFMMLPFFIDYIHKKNEKTQ